MTYHVNGDPLVVRTFAFDLVEGDSALLLGGFPFDEKFGYFVQYAPDLISKAPDDVGRCAPSVSTKGIKSELIIFRCAGYGNKLCIAAEPVLAIDLAFQAI